MNATDTQNAAAQIAYHLRHNQQRARDIYHEIVITTGSIATADQIWKQARELATWKPEDFQPGDIIGTARGVQRVVRIDDRGLTVENGGLSELIRFSVVTGNYSRD